MRDRDHPQTAGFTLVEVLVSLALTGMAAALLLQGLATAGLIAQRVRTVDQGLEVVTTVQRTLRSRIESLYGIARADRIESIVDVEGSRGSFAFIAPPFGGDGPQPLQRYRLTTSARGDLILWRASYRDPDLDRDPRSTRGWTAVPLLRGLSGLSIRYFGADGRGTEQRWQNDWTNQPQPPTLVRIHIDFPVGDRRTWPDLVIQPRATVNTLCRIDPITGRCGGGE